MNIEHVTTRDLDAWLRKLSTGLVTRDNFRKHIVTRDGRIMIPFQHYIGPDDEQGKEPLDRAFTNPRNGVLISSDGGIEGRPQPLE